MALVHQIHFDDGCAPHCIVLRYWQNLESEKRHGLKEEFHYLLNLKKAVRVVFLLQRVHHERLWLKHEFVQFD